jgi:hypothetical protein
MPIRPRTSPQRYGFGFTCVLVGLLALVATTIGVHASSSTTSNSLPRSSTKPSSSSIPRSNNSHRRRITEQSPPWNPSAHIDPDGFLSGLYPRVPGEWESQVRSIRGSLKKEDCHAIIRQVPGDGNCLFHSISLCLHHAVNGTHWNLTANEPSDSSSSSSTSTMELLYQQSQILRAQAVDCLRQSQRRLFLQGKESLRANELVSAAAQQYGLTAEEYCAAMQQDCVWGGGPEIVALSNLLERPIHVYELAVLHSQQEQSERTSSTRSQLSSTSASSYPKSTFCLRRMACFGSPKFDRRPALHILSADSRFPDLQPGQQLAAGNHFLAVFPRRQKIRRRRLRGGGDDYYWNTRNMNDHREHHERLPLRRRPEDANVDDANEEEEEISSLSWKQWWKSVVFRIVE